MSGRGPFWTFRKQK